MLDLERIDLGEGRWWDIRLTLTRAMDKAITRASLLAIPKIETSQGIDTEKVKMQLLDRLGAVDISAIEDAYLLHGTVAYSFGDRISLDIIDQVDATLVRRVITRMFEVYNAQRLTEEQRDGFFVKPSKPS